MTKFSQGVSYRRLRILFTTISIMILSACDGSDFGSQEKREMKGMKSIETCISEGVSKGEVLPLLNQCGIQGEIAPEPLGEYRADVDKTRKSFEDADDVRIQGPYDQKYGSHAVVVIHLNEKGVLDIDANAAAMNSNIYDRLSEVESLADLQTKVDEILLMSESYRAFLHRKDWKGIAIDTTSEQDVRYLMDLSNWVVVTDSGGDGRTCILNFEEAKLANFNCNESEL